MEMDLFLRSRFTVTLMALKLGDVIRHKESGTVIGTVCGIYQYQTRTNLRRTKMHIIQILRPWGTVTDFKDSRSFLSAIEKVDVPQP